MKFAGGLYISTDECSVVGSTAQQIDASCQAPNYLIADSIAQIRRNDKFTSMLGPNGTNKTTVTSFDTVLPIYGNGYKGFCLQVYNDDYFDALKYCLYITIAITVTSNDVVSVIYVVRAHAQSLEIIMASDSPKESDTEIKNKTTKAKNKNLEFNANPNSHDSMRRENSITKSYSSYKLQINPQQSVSITDNYSSHGTHSRTLPEAPDPPSTQNNVRKQQSINNFSNVNSMRSTRLPSHDHGRNRSWDSMQTSSLASMNTGVSNTPWPKGKITQLVLFTNLCNSYWYVAAEISFDSLIIDIIVKEELVMCI